MSISSSAYSIPILHAARYPSNTVLGLLIGTSSSGSIVVEDAIPLVHRYTSLSPTTELGIDLVRARVSKEGKAIVGVYVAHDGDSRAADAVLRAIRTEVPGAILLTLDNDKLRTSEPAFIASSEVTYPPESVRAGILKLVREKSAHESVRDLDDHLDDSTVEWMSNAEAHKAIATLS